MQSSNIDKYLFNGENIINLYLNKKYNGKKVICADM